LATNSVGTGYTAQTPFFYPNTSPGQPVITTATPGNGLVALGWTIPSTNGAAITSYTVVPTPACGSCGGLITTSQNQNSTDISGLSNGTAYTFTVSATNADGTGLASAPSNSITPGSTPSTTTGLSAVAPGGAGTATITWTVPANNGAPITGFAVSTNYGSLGTLPAEAVGSPLDPTPGAVDSYTFPNSAQVPLGSSVDFVVVAINSFGAGPGTGSNAVIPTAVPSAPTIGTANPGPDAAAVDFTTVNDGGSALISITVTPYLNGVAQAPQYTTSQTDTGFPGNQVFVWNLTPGDSYTFTVAETNAYGTSAASAQSNSVTVT
jgi:titin